MPIHQFTSTPSTPDGGGAPKYNVMSICPLNSSFSTGREGAKDGRGDENEKKKKKKKKKT
jgi:hypothetical protein